ncbi:alkaline phosphatase [Desulfovibrio aminophilus]|nr:alkaline phosphatase [Desulfovibrio aminophilus]MCM0756812.1 alkaline phosphatase [Desulfovibrio aminophilus]
MKPSLSRAAVVLLTVLALCTVLAGPASAGDAPERKPKYVFLFIGDGMGLPQISAAQYYYAAKEGKAGESKLLMTGMPYQGITTTYSSESPITDSAAAGTAMACGVKTYNAGLGLDAQKKPYRSIAELAKAKGMKVGIVTSVSLDHATPAAFYAHQESRRSYHEIGHELAKSGFDYFAGGGFLDPEGKKSKAPQGNVVEAVKKAGYTVVDDRAGFEALGPKSGKVVAMNKRLPDEEAMPYAIDTKNPDVTLAEFTAKGIRLLDNSKGFFMMVEGGKIDWSCHANDAATTLADMMAFNAAIAEARTFAEAHPKDTLIVVTGDHETGGLTVGFAGTKYANYFTVLDGQKTSFQAFRDEVLAPLTASCGSKCRFEDVQPLITQHFGLKFAGDPKTDRLVLKDYEVAQLREAFQRTLAGEKEASKDEQGYLLYGGYDPLTVTVTHLLNQKAGLGWTTYSHTGVPVATAAQGPGGKLFAGYYDNTDIFKKLAAAMGLDAKPTLLAKN